MPDTTYDSNGWTPERLSSLSNKTYIITGANSGTGFQAARTFLRHGAKVVMLNRSANKSEAAIAELKAEMGREIDVSFILCDLASLGSVRRAAAKVLATVPRIDSLNCNAAIAQVPEQRLTEDGFESMLGTNHYGHFLLCGLLFERIAQSQGRIVVVSSLGYDMGLKTIQFDDMNWDANYHQNRTYSQSKLAQMMFAYELQDRMDAAGRDDVKAYVCHPGSSRTSLIDTSGNFATRLMFKIMTKLPITQPAENGAWPQVMCATEEGLEQRALYGPTGFQEFVGPVGKGTLQAHAYDKITMSRLWEVSEDAVEFEWTL